MMSDSKPKHREWEPVFKYLFERTGEVRLSAERSGVSEQAVYRLRRRDPSFRSWMESVRHSRRRRALERNG